VIHADPRTSDVAELIADMSSKVASGFLVGGLSSSRARAVQVANEVISGGLSGAVFAASVGVSTRLTQGCAPLPGRYRVTECDANVISTLDGRPALEVMKEAIGEVLARDLRRAAQFIHVGLPVAGSDRGDYLVRNLVGIDSNNGLIAIGDMVEPGADLIFCKRDAESARRDLRRILGELREERRRGCAGRCTSPASVAASTCSAAAAPARPERGFGRTGAGRILLQRRNLPRPALWLHRRADAFSLRSDLWRKQSGRRLEPE
jgi:small ligand-binding sensory domain FIST